MGSKPAPTYLEAVGARNGLADEPISASDLKGKEIYDIQEVGDNYCDVTYKGVTELAGMDYDVTIRKVPKQYLT